MDEEKQFTIQQLGEMGFEREHVIQAISKTRSSNLQRVMDYIFEYPYDPNLM